MCLQEVVVENFIEPPKEFISPLFFRNIMVHPVKNFKEFEVALVIILTVALIALVSHRTAPPKIQSASVFLLCVFLKARVTEICILSIQLSSVFANFYFKH